MKIRILASLLCLGTFFSPIAQAETFTYQPNWEIGHTVRYETFGDYQYSTPIFPILKKTGSKVFSFNIVTSHKVIDKTNEFTEFVVSVEKIDFESPVLDLLMPNWRTEFPRLWKIDMIGLEKLICNSNGLVSYQIDSDGEIIRFTQLEKWNSFYNQYLKFTDPEKKKPRITKKTEASALRYSERQFNQDAPYTIYFGFHDQQFFNKVFELGQSSPTELKYRNGQTQLILNGTTQTTGENHHVTVQSTYPFSDKLMQIKSSNPYGRANSIYIGATNPLAVGTISTMNLLDSVNSTNLKGISFHGTLVSTFKFSVTESFPTFLSHQIQFDGNLHPDQFPLIRTRSKTPVPFKGSFTLTSTKLSETQKIGGK